MNSPIFLLIFGGLVIWGVIRRLFIPLPRPSSIDPDVIAAFRRIRLRQWAISIPMAILVVCLEGTDGRRGAANDLGWPLMLLILVVAFWFTYRNWRCPKCDAYLGRYPTYYGVCPKCGMALLNPDRYQHDDLQ